MLAEEFIPIIQGMGKIQDHWFMQDGARPHRTGEVFDLLNEHFGDRVVGLDYAEYWGGSGWDWSGRD